jgi:hypothetical protein
MTRLIDPGEILQLFLPKELVPNYVWIKKEFQQTGALKSYSHIELRLVS